MSDLHARAFCTKAAALQHPVQSNTQSNPTPLLHTSISTRQPVRCQAVQLGPATCPAWVTLADPGRKQQRCSHVQQCALF